MAGNDQDISSMTSRPMAMGESDTPDHLDLMQRDPQIINQALAQPMGGGLSTEAAKYSNNSFDMSPPMSGLAALGSQQPLPITAQSAYAPSGPNQQYLDELNAYRNEIKSQTNTSQVPWFQLAAAFLSPGKTGSFGEALGGAAGAMGKYQEEEKAKRLPLMQAGLKAAELGKQEATKGLMGELYQPVKDEAGNTTYKFNPEVAQQLARATGDPKYASMIVDESIKQQVRGLKGSLFSQPDGSVGLNHNAFQGLYALDSKDALDTIKAIPEMRRFGILPSTGAEGTPFDALAMVAEGPFKAQAMNLAERFKQGLIKEEDADKMTNQLLTAMTSHMDKQSAQALSAGYHTATRALVEDRIAETKKMNDYKIAEKEKAKEDALEKQDAMLSNLSTQVSTVRNSPGRGAATFPVAGPLISMLPKTDALEFSNQMKTLKSQQFLNNIQGMKGMGSLSNAEGEKVMNLITSLDPQMSKPAFDRALDQIDKFVQNGRQNIQRQRNGQTPKFIEPDHPAESKPEGKTIDFHDLPKKGQ